MALMFLSFRLEMLLFMLLAVQIATTSADYECLCSRNASAKVYFQPFEFSAVLGSLRTGECKPTILAGTSIRWRAIQFHQKVNIYTVELQWFEHLWNHENMFEIWVIRANEY